MIGYGYGDGGGDGDGGGGQSAAVTGPLTRGQGEKS